tara:strand:+ start:132 stop:512 length:381 start_codon:yes stop_codon:yes gene_type:complete
MAFKMKGFSAFTQKKNKNGKRGYDTYDFDKIEEEQQKIAENQDPPSGLNQADEMKRDMEHAQKLIEEAKYNLKNNPHNPNGDKKEKEKYDYWMKSNNMRLSNLTQAFNRQKRMYLRFLSEKGMLPK